MAVETAELIASVWMSKLMRPALASFQLCRPSVLLRTPPLGILTGWIGLTNGLGFKAPA